ncbi:TIR domain-containing protein [Desulfovibrio inopinatus]|uniref:nSTAND1 domain-containing NTPase n=1 Tax=Desulfovibrio inopinatus TaxID=102109 RepID=UPI00042867C7|nr:TIR domain-containing protein [Desulfovibrio inopinatus]
MRAFISYNSIDQKVADKLNKALMKVLPGFASYFAPRSNIGGAYWLPQLGEEIERADIVLLLLGSHVGTWQELEYYEALRLNRTNEKPHIIPILLGEESPGLQFLHQLHRLRFDDNHFDRVIDQISAVVQNADVGAARQPLWREINPYCGLQAMGSADAAHFFGREDLTDQIIAQLHSHRNKVLTLVGNSGVGKSSIVNAGVLAALRSQLRPVDMNLPWPKGLLDSVAWLPVVIRPGERPLLALARGFNQTWISDDSARVEAQALQWENNFKNGADLSGLIQVAQDCIAERTKAAPPARFLLYIDQGEELYSRSGTNEAKRFSELVAAAVGMPEFSVLTSLRSDFYGHLQDDQALFDVTERIDVPSLTREQLEKVIHKPADMLGARFESAEIVSMIAEATAKESGALPLLSYMMTETWETMRRDETSDGVMRFAAGFDMGKSLALRAERFLEQHAKDERELQRLFTLRLTHVPKQGDVVRRQATKTECTPKEWGLSQELTGKDWRLLVTSEQAGGPSVEVGHEALLRAWPRLTRWLDQEREFLIWKGQLEAARLEWESAPQEKKDTAVLMGLPLETACFWMRAREASLAGPDVMFIQQSMKLDAARTASAAKLRRWMMALVAAVVVVLLILWGKTSQMNASLETQLFATRIEQGRYRAATAKALYEQGLFTEALTVAMSIFPRDMRSQWPRIEQEASVYHIIRAAIGRVNLVCVLRGHGDGVSSEAYSPDGTRIVTASHDGTARIWDATTGKELAVLRGDGDPVNSAAYSPDGTRIVTASHDGTARIWDATTGKELAVLRGYGDPVNSAAYSPDGTRIVTASDDDTVRVWDADTGKQLAVLRGHDFSVTSAEYSPDGTRIVTASWDNTARIWDAATGKQLAVLSGHGDSVVNATFSPDGTRIVTASRDNLARVWDAATGKQLAVLRGHDSWVDSAAFSPDGTRIVTASPDDTARVWDAATGKQLAVLSGHDNGVTSAEYSPDGTRIVTASWDNTARIWDPAMAQGRAVLHGHDSTETNVAYSPDGPRIVTASDDDTAQVWDPAMAERLGVRLEHGIITTCAAFSPDSTRIVTASVDHTARIWDAAMGKELIVLHGHDLSFTNTAFSPDGTRIVTASWDNLARVWDAATGKELSVLRGHDSRVNSAEYSPDGTRIVTASDDDTARIWDAVTDKELAVLRGHDNGVESAAYSPDGTRIVTASDDGTARIWDAATGKQLAVLRGHDSRVYSAAFSPDGTRIVTASDDDTARIWDAVTDKELAVLRGHDEEVMSAAYSPDGTRIVTASGDCTARIWDAATGKQQVMLHGHTDGLSTAAFSPDGTRIVTAAVDDIVRVWESLPLEALLDSSRRLLDRIKPLNHAQECKYFLRVDGCEEH